LYVAYIALGITTRTWCF